MRSPTVPAKSRTLAPGVKLDGYIARHDEFRGRILDAAEELIVETGDTSFAMRDLAARAGVSAATPFNHFGSKRGVLSAIIERSLEQLEAEREQSGPVGDPLEQIFRHTESVVAFYAAKPELFRPVFGGLAGSEGDAPHYTLQRATASWRAGLDAAAAAGQLQPERNLDVIANQLETSWIGALTLWIVGQADGDRWKAQSEYGTALILVNLVVAAQQDRLRGQIATLEDRLARGPGGRRLSAREF